MLSRKTLHKIFTLNLIMYLIISPVYGFKSQFVKENHDFEVKLFNNFDSLTDIQQSLIASGVDPDSYNLYTREIHRWKNEIEKELPPEASDRTVAKTIVRYLHDKVFIKYKLSATTLKEVFEDGLFNCLSATVLVNLLLKMFDIQAKSIVLPSHIYTLAILDGKPVEIENTIREGLMISEDAQVQKKFNQLTGFDYAPNDSKKYVVSWFETIGLLYSNRSYFDSKSKKAYQAFQNMLKAQIFLSDLSSEHNNLSAGYLNYSYYMYSKKSTTLPEYIDILGVLEEGIVRYPTYNGLRGNYLKGIDLVVDKLISLETQTNVIDQVLTKSKQYLKATDFQKVQKNYLVKSAVYSLRTKTNYTKALQTIQKLTQLDPKDKQIDFLFTEYLHSRAKTKLEENSRSIDVDFVKELQQFPENLVKDVLIWYHNEIAERQFKAKMYDETLKTIEFAFTILGVVPVLNQNGFAFAVNIAQHYIQENNTDEALKFYQKSLTYKKDRQIINNISILYTEKIKQLVRTGQKKEAEGLLNKALEILPQDPRIQQMKSYILLP